LKTVSKNLSGLEGDSVKTVTLDNGMKGRDYSLPFMLNIITPKNTSITSYIETEIILPIGRINKLWIEFPKGCSGLVGFQVWRNPRQIFPIPAGQWMLGDGYIIPLAFTHIIETEPYKLSVRSYNLDDTYQHRIMIVMEMSGLSDPVNTQLAGLLDTLKG